MKKGTKLKRIGTKALAGLSSAVQLQVIAHGEDFIGKKWALDLAVQLHRVVSERDRQNLELKIFRPLKEPPVPKADATIEEHERLNRTPAALAWRSKELMCEVANIVADAVSTGKVDDLRVLADAIESVAERHRPDEQGYCYIPVRDALREFIVIKFKGFSGTAQKFTGTFTEARKIIANRFSDFPDDPRLRKLFTEHGIKFPKCKPGRKRVPKRPPVNRNKFSLS